MERILFVCGYIPDSQKIRENTINYMNTASNVFTQQFIDGLRENDKNVTVLSAPFIGAYPINYKKIIYSHEDCDDNYHYVSFFNLWGLRNIFRYYSLIREIKRKRYYEFDSVIIYSVHTPFAKLAKFLKKKNNNCKICLITPDLPEYMNLREKKSLAYIIAKKFDCQSFYKCMKYFDCFSFVTQYQNIINFYSRPAVIIEAFSNSITRPYFQSNNLKKKIVYTGTLNVKFGILNLIEAFLLISEDAELIICGNGDAIQDIKKFESEYDDIHFLGELSHEEVKKIQAIASILINPRKNNEEYTKYSFPSKTLEYLSTGHPVICYKLDGIPDEYDAHLIYPQGESLSDLADTIDYVLGFNEEKLRNIHLSNITFLNNKKNKKHSVKKIINMFEKLSSTGDR